MTKQKLISIGWTSAKLRERIQGCRDGIKEVDRTKPSAWTYRALFISFYRQYKSWLVTLNS